MGKILKSIVKTEKNKLKNFKAKNSEIKLMEQNAAKYAGGNFSLWIRYAAMNYVPKKNELSDV